jgi:Putative ribonucleoprotein zinc-finger pf C4 type
MTIHKCKICLSSQIIDFKDTIFCENCDIYYSVINGTQHVKTLPIKNISQHSLNLCKTCEANILTHKKISCKTFLQYFHKLRLCKPCKALNKDYISNLFYKNFLLHKNTIRLFSDWEIPALCIAYYFMGDSILFNWFIVIFNKYRSYRYSFRKLILITILIYKLQNYEFPKLICFIYSILVTLLSKTVIYNVPTNFSSDEELDSFIKDLSIRGSVVEDSSIYKNSCVSVSCPRMDNVSRFYK